MESLNLVDQIIAYSEEPDETPRDKMPEGKWYQANKKIDSGSYDSGAMADNRKVSTDGVLALVWYMLVMIIKSQAE